MVANTLVVVVRVCGRRRRLRSSHICTLTLAVSDVAFSLLVHTLMILASLGVDPMLIFNRAGALVETEGGDVVIKHVEGDGKMICKGNWQMEGR